MNNSVLKYLFTLFLYLELFYWDQETWTSVKEKIIIITVALKLNNEHEVFGPAFSFI